MCLTKPNSAHNRMKSKPKPKQTKIKEHPTVRKCESIFGAQFPFDKWVTAVHKHPTSLFQEDTLIMVTTNGDIRRGSYTIDYTTIDPVRISAATSLCLAESRNLTSAIVHVIDTGSVMKCIIYLSPKKNVPFRSVFN